ncbi:hypothetical protein ACLOJK_027629 [Asimina triloba]
MGKVPSTFGDGRAAQSRARRATTNVVKLDLMTKRVVESRLEAKQRQPTEIPVTPLDKKSIKIRTEVLELLIHEAEILQLVPRRIVKVAEKGRKKPYVVPELYGEIISATQNPRPTVPKMSNSPRHVKSSSPRTPKAPPIESIVARVSSQQFYLKKS